MIVRILLGDGFTHVTVAEPHFSNEVGALDRTVNQHGVGPGKVAADVIVSQMSCVVA